MRMRSLAKSTGRRLDRPRISGSNPRLSLGRVCIATRTQAPSVGDRPAAIVVKASSPPADAPMTTKSYWAIHGSHARSTPAANGRAGAGRPRASVRVREPTMPEKKTLERARKDKREGKAPSTQAGEFVREEIEHVREGKHGARSTKQAIAIGLSKARRAGVALPPPERGTTSRRTRQSAESAYKAGQEHPSHAPSPTRSRSATRALKRESHQTASRAALSAPAHASARRRHSRKK